MDPSQHATNRGWIESILLHIPGFKGYLQKEYRRESDQLIRTYMADRLQRAKRGLDEYNLKLVSAGQLDALTAAEQARTRTDREINRLRSAPRGYSGFFDYVQKGEAQLEAIYEHDMQAVTEVDSLAKVIEQLPTAADGPKSLAEILTRIDTVDQKLNEREEMLRGLATPPK